MKFGSVVVASRSPAVVRRFSAVIKRTGYQGGLFKASASQDIDTVLAVKDPDMLFLERCFFRGATERRVLEYLEKYPDLRVVCFDGFPYQAWIIARLFRAGVLGYIDVREGEDYIMDALGKVLRGAMFVPPHIEKVNMDIDIMPSLKSDIDATDVEIMMLAADELDGEEIAAQLDVKGQTVRNRRNRLYEVTGCHNVVGLVRYALRHGYIDRAGYCGCTHCHEARQKPKKKAREGIYDYAI
jgi:DNA-binding NarL/FixJ family response regulator